MAAPTSRPPLDTPSIVEHVLLLFEHPGTMPLLAEFPASAQVRLREDAAHFGPHGGRLRKRGYFAGRESAVAGQKHRTVAVQPEALAIHQKHGHAGLVLGLVPDLFDLEIVGLDGDGGAKPYFFALARGRVAIDGAGVGERSVVEERFVAFPPPFRSEHAADARQFHVAEILA